MSCLAKKGCRDSLFGMIDKYFTALTQTPQGTRPLTHWRALPAPVLAGWQEKGAGSYSKRPRALGTVDAVKAVCMTVRGMYLHMKLISQQFCW